MTPSPTLTRAPFELNRLDEALAFCAQHGSTHYNPSLLGRLLSTLTSSLDGVFYLFQGTSPAALLSLVDTVKNANAAATLELLALAPEINATAVLDAVLPDAYRLTRAARRRALEIELVGALKGQTDTLAARGFRHSHTMVEMRRPAGTMPAVISPPSTMRWVKVKPETVAAYHGLVTQAFEKLPGAHVPELERFEAHVLSADIAHELLMEGDHLIGFASAVLRDPDEGIVATIGRHPSARGRGLGPIVLSRAMQLSANRGASHFFLGASATNEQALSLYRKAGFRITSQAHVWSRALDADSSPDTRKLNE